MEPPEMQKNKRKRREWRPPVAALQRLQWLQPHPAPPLESDASGVVCVV